MQQVNSEQHGNTRQARHLLWAAGIINVLVFFLTCSAFAAAASSVSGGGVGAAGMVLIMLVALGFGVFALTFASKQGYWFERSKIKIWQRVCFGLGGSFVAEVFSLGKSIGEGLKAKPGQHVGNQTQKGCPRLKDVYGKDDSWTGLIEPFYGQTVDEYNKHSASFTLAYRVPFVNFDLDEATGLIRIRAGQVPVPSAFGYSERVQAPQVPIKTTVLQQNVAHVDVPGNSLLDVAHNLQKQGFGKLFEQVPAVRADSQSANVWAYELGLLQAVPMAIDLNGREVKMPIEGQHWLVAARTGGGKGSWIWSLVLGLEPAFRRGLVKFWGCDPKRLELAIGREWWEHYADTNESMVELLEQAVKDMHERGSELQGKKRKFTPTLQTPLNVVVVDEYGYLTAMMPDKKLRVRAEDALTTLLSQGRAAGYAVVGAVQDPRKETVNNRDLFPIRIAGGLPAPMVDIVLGDDMHDAGALCEQIPLGTAGAGVAYVISEKTLKPMCVRAAWCSDDDIQGMLQGAMLSPKKPLNPGDVQDEDLSNLGLQQGQAAPNFQYRIE